MKTATWKTTLAGLGLALATLLLPGCGGSNSVDDVLTLPQFDNPQQGPAPVATFQVLNRYPHDPNAFTQGLLFANNRLYESTGLVGESSLREVELVTGKVVRIRDNDAEVFAEGLALRAGKLYQLTLDEGLAYVWDQAAFSLNGTVATRKPAWGLTYIEADDLFAFSDGTSTIRYLNPTTFAEVSSVKVTDNGVEVGQLNELEFVRGYILANRFMTDEIVAINPQTGVVAFRINLAGIIDKAANGLGANDVLNGIAFDPNGTGILVTGKNWPYLYHIRIVEP